MHLDKTLSMSESEDEGGEEVVQRALWLESNFSMFCGLCSLDEDSLNDEDGGRVGDAFSRGKI